jgi:peptidoglycan/xylan/chitin deacetylase (PgdA/CDA1 family)
MARLFLRRVFLLSLSFLMLLSFSHSSVDAYPNRLPLYPSQCDYQEISSMDHGWENVYRTGHVYYDDYFKIEGNASLAMQIDKRDRSHIVGASISFPPRSFEYRAFRFFIRVSDWNDIELFSILLNSNGMWHDMYAVDVKSLLTTPNNEEWMEVVLSRSELFAVQQPTWSSINKVMFRLISKPNTEPTVWIDNFGHFESAKKPYLSIIFDDGMSVVYDYALPVFEEFGVRGSCFIIPDFIGLEGEGFMTQRQVDFLAYWYGWGIGGHDWMKLTDLPMEHSPGDPSWLYTLDESLARNKAYFEKHRYPGRDCYAIPYGAYNEKVLDTISKYYTYIRPHNNLSQPSGYVSPSTINSHVVYADLPFEEVQRWIRNAKENGDWVILVMHRVVPNPRSGIDTENSVDYLRQILDYALYIEEVDVLPFHEVLEEYYPLAG